MEIENIIEKIVSNLHKHGFPEKKVSFPLQSIETFIKKNDFDLEDVMGTLEEDEIFSKVDGQKIIFSSQEWKEQKTSSNIDWSFFKNMDPNTLREQAEKMMKTMTPSQLEEIQKRYENMSPEEKAKIMEMTGKLKQ